MLRKKVPIVVLAAIVVMASTLGTLGVLHVARLASLVRLGRALLGPSGANLTVLAAGLNNPRGLTFGPDGTLYVAEGGTGGTDHATTPAQCPQVPAPLGPVTGDYTARISRIAPDGTRTTVVDHLPSSQTASASGSLVTGVAGVAVIGQTLYGLEAGAGCAHGLWGTTNTLFRVNPNGTTTTIADLSTFVKASHGTSTSSATDSLLPDDTWYALIAVGDSLYATEPMHGEVDRITREGQITRVADLSPYLWSSPDDFWQGPTGIAYQTGATYQGSFDVATLGTFPVRPGTQSLYRLTRSGSVQVAAVGLTAVLSLAFDARGRLYALETDTVAGFPGPEAAGSGQVVRVNGDGSLTPVATGLTFPTAMTFGPDGALYISNLGFGIPVPGAGQIVRMVAPDA
jgi:hypothetical protein